jgi:gliding motility-associated-like protein
MNSQCTGSKFENKVDPTCGANGVISFRYEPAPLGVIYTLYKDNVPAIVIKGASINMGNLDEGTYYVSFRDSATQCVDQSSTFVLSKNTNALKATIAMDSAKCDSSKNGRLTVTATGGALPYSYKWSQNISLNSRIDSTLKPGSYTVTITDNAACSITISGTVFAKISKIKLKTITVLNAECNQSIGKIDVKIEGGYAPIRYRWKDSTRQKMPFDSLAPGKFTVYFWDTLACDTFAVKDILVQNIPGPKGSLVGTDSICPLEGVGKLYINVSSGDTNNLSYIWKHAPSNRTRLAESLDSGNYIAIIKDRAGCTDTLRKRIELYPEKRLSISGRTEMVAGQTQILKVDSSFYFYEFVWSPKINARPANNNYEIYPNENTLYTLEARYGPNCLAVARFQVSIVDAIDSIIVPNIFTPYNQDSKNDYFYLKTNKTNIVESFEFKVYDKWGNNVFNAYDLDFKWDGKAANGNFLETGVYTYMMRYNSIYSKYERIVRSGQILLLK